MAFDFAKEVDVFGTPKKKRRKDELVFGLKKLFKEAGIKASVRHGKGTAWNWIDVNVPMEQQDRAMEFGLPRSSETRGEVEALIGKARYKSIINSNEYRKLKLELLTLARKHDAIGTAVGGSGVYVLKNGVKIDFIRNPNQSEQGLWKAEQILASKFVRLGLTLEHEGGWMD